jgi:anthranilate phosphoribosyltransferase
MFSKDSSTPSFNVLVKPATLKEGVEESLENITKGRGLEKLEELSAYSQSLQKRD